MTPARAARLTRTLLCAVAFTTLVAGCFLLGAAQFGATVAAWGVMAAATVAAWRIDTRPVYPCCTRCRLFRGPQHRVERVACPDHADPVSIQLEQELRP